jgi:chromosomal replication initiator protein
MAHVPRGQSRPGALSIRRARPPAGATSPPSAAASFRPPRSLRVFLALCANAPVWGRLALVYSPALGHGVRVPFSLSSTASPRRSRSPLPDHVELGPAWGEIRAQLRRTVGDSTYELWLAPLEIDGWDGTLLRLRGPNTTVSWVSARFGRAVQSCVQRVLGPSARVELIDAGARRGEPRDERAPSLGRDQFNPRYNFAQFIIGEGNRLAHAAALAVAELPGQAYNPLFLHAPPGLGKTHLLHAIANYLRQFGDDATVRYVTAEDFTTHFLSALGSRSLGRFKQRYRDADILLVDDVQFLASKAKTEEEFFHTFNALYETGRQLVLTCDRMPAALVSVEERLRERFEAGLVADIHPPDFPTRLTILRKRAELDRLPLADSEALELIARRITSNVRALEGALIRVVAYHSLTGRRIDAELTRQVLDRIHPAGEEALTVPQIQLAVAKHYGISQSELLANTRRSHVAWPRQVAIYLSRELGGASLHSLGEQFGGRSHTTILHACKRVADRLEIDRQAVVDVQALASSLRSEHSDRSC